MMAIESSIFNWSGGKDSTLALHHVLQEGYFDVRYLLTTVNDAYNRVSMHGVREALLIEQAESIGIPLYQVRLSESPMMQDYEDSMEEHLNRLKGEGVAYSIFGDIFLEDLMAYRVHKLAELDLKAVFPLWKRNTTELIKEFIGLGYKTVVVCAQEGLEEFCGRVIDESFIADLPKGIDPCGENGEFHTFVFDGPIFKSPIRYSLGELVYKAFPSPVAGVDTPAGFWYMDLLPVV